MRYCDRRINAELRIQNCFLTTKCTKDTKCCNFNPLALFRKEGAAAAAGVFLVVIAVSGWSVGMTALGHPYTPSQRHKKIGGNYEPTRKED